MISSTRLPAYLYGGAGLVKNVKIKNIRMKKALYILLPVILFSAGSCKKWLDVDPRSIVKEEEMFEDAQGFRTVLVSEADHPFWQWWWPQGHMIGWEHTFVHEIHHFLSAIREDTDIAPHGATFEDGYRAAEICDAMLRSADSGCRETVVYRT